MFKMKSFSVSEINQYIKRLLSTDPLISHVSIEGEVSNFVRHSSGHAYFTLKDSQSKISCVMFSRQLDALLVKPKNGDHVKAFGQVTVYERDGRYQLVVESMDLQGLGALHIRFEALKKELESQGFFSQAHKKSLPLFPKKVAVITSATGAALQDIISVAQRRSGITSLLVIPVHVQGEKAAPEICTAITRANEMLDVDLIILARGGGSIEELWAFNEKVVAKAIFDSVKPIVTGIGHETDFTISDFVSDLRAATPSAAAEIAIRSKVELSLQINRALQNIHSRMSKHLIREKAMLEQRGPERLSKAMKVGLMNPMNRLTQYERQIYDLLKHRLQIESERLKKYGAQLSAYNPLGVLNRGYALVYKEAQLINTVSSVEVNDRLNVHLSDGGLEVQVLNKRIRKAKGVQSG